MITRYYVISWATIKNTISNMGKIMVKAQQQSIYNIDGKGTTGKAYVLRPVRYSTMRQKDIVNYCMKNSLVPQAYISAAVIAFVQCIENFLLNGHSVELPSLGIFHLTSNGISAQEIKDCGLHQLQALKVRFIPSTSLKDAVEAVDLEFDGVYDIAGETVLETDSDGNPTKTRKYYKKVVAGENEIDIDNPDDSTNGGENNGGDSSNDPENDFVG